MYLWRLVSFLSALAATGYSLQCYNCSDFNTDSCLFSSIASCPTGNVCATQYEVSLTGIFIVQFLNRFCAQPSECDATGTFNTSTSTSQNIATTCCSENLCTPEKPIVPDGSLTPDGLKCPTCSPLESSCETLNYLNCAGDQTMCLHQTRKQTTGSITVTTMESGCASQGFCYKRNESSTSGPVLTEITYSCTRATSISDAASTTKSTAQTILLSVLPFVMLLVPFNMCRF
ncbi:uncharacterized protein LOC143770477 [Ranitomeya variabilis]|uniref:uncharacterized protein LOC143770477 n=1 Tax=Ranitomeya variabilis TaxID=490064 RepID=UPI004055D3D7